MGTYHVVRTALAAIFFLTFTYSTAQENVVLKKGAVLDSLAVPGSQLVYSLYLPTFFETHKKIPIILGFDTLGKASAITRLFKNTAEELGYIVVSTDIPKTYSPKQKSEYTLAFMEYIYTLFSPQDDMMYVTGIDQDAIYASKLAVTYSNHISGVIAIGNSTFYNVKTQLKRNTTHIGIVNTYNFRYIDLLDNKKYLLRKAIPADVYVYNTKSEVPSQELLNKTLTNFTLQAMSKGKIPKDTLFIRNQYLKNLKEVETYIHEKDFLTALEETKRIRSVYGVFYNTDTLTVKEKEIKALKEYKKQKRQWSKYTYKERILRETFLQALEEDVEFIEYDNLGWWNYQIAELDTLTKSEQAIPRQMANRLKGYLKYVIDIYTTSMANEKDIEKKLFVHIISTLVDPRDYQAYLRIIAIAAQDQDKETALFYLEKLLENGYTDFKSLYTVDGTLALKLSKEYNNIIKKYLGKAKYSH